MRIKFPLLIGFLLMLAYLSCRKIENRRESSPSEIEHRFFNTHNSSDPNVIAGVQFVKSQNIKYGFVENLTNTIGYPYWDKSLVSRRDHARGGGGESIVFVPFIHESKNVVSNLLILEIGETDTNFHFVGDWQYRSLTKGSPEIDTTSENLASLFMVFDNLVFAYERFKIKDTTLFEQFDSALTFSGRELSINFSARGTTNNISTESETITLCFYGYHCGSPNASTCNDGNGCDYQNCPTNVCYVVTTSCFEFGSEEFFSWDGAYGGGMHGGSGDPGEGGGSYGGWDPPECEGLGGRNFDECQPGWEPVPTYENPTPNMNPCDVVDSLLRTTKFPQHLDRLRDSAIHRPERLILFTTPDTSQATSSEIPGTGFLEVSFDPPNAVDGMLHNHYDTTGALPGFSADDVVSLARLFVHNKIKNYRTFTFTIVTASASYILMIEDSLQFRRFCETWFNNDDHIAAFHTTMYDTYEYDADGLSSGEREKRFLKALDAFPAVKSGLRLFRGNSTMTAFTPIKLNSAGTVRPSPCN